MTTIETVETRRNSVRGILIAAACGAALSLAGCETSSSLLGPNNSPAASSAIAPPAIAQAAPKTATRVAIAPIIGPPDSVSKALIAQLSDAAERQQVAIAKGSGDVATYTLRGYFVAPAKDKASNKLSYIWDVTDAAVKRVNRITGEEVLTPGGGGDAWASVTPQIMQTISDKTASALASWLPTQNQGEVPVAGSATSTSAVAQGPLPPPTNASAAAGATGSLPSTLLSTPPKVSGAPGDGNSSLAAAMRRELTDKGVQVADAGGATAYRVAADVKIKPPKDGMQAIAINWTINDPKGTEVAKITQNNEVPAGFLDKSWGPSAEDAAKAASVQIKQVIADHRAGKQIQSSAGGERKVN